MSILLWLAISYVNVKIIGYLIELFTAGHFRWMLAGTITWAYILFGPPLI